jgi:SagB-type dehydrogenase family enzyme
MNQDTKVRRSRHLVSYWSDEGIVITNYATGSSVVADALVSHVLNLSGDWTNVRTLRERLTGVSTRTIDDLVRSMLDEHLLHRAGDRPDKRERALETWSAWNPAAGFFHFSTKDQTPPPNPAPAEQALQREARATGVPAPIKRYQRCARAALPPPAKDGEFARVLLERRTWRGFGESSVTLADVSTLLNLTWGVQRVAKSTLGNVRLKTSPSSGARQPLEAYMLAVDVKGLEPGLYHYSADDHALELIRKGASSRTIAQYIPGQGWYEKAAALFLTTAVFARTQWRYRFPRAYRSVLLEAGHVCQTFCLTATWLRLAPFCTGRFADSFVESQLRIDGITESFVYGAGIGSRPPGVSWAPWPLNVTPTGLFPGETTANE